MYIETTINVSASVFDLISRAVLSTGQSKNQIISSIMRRLGNDHEKLMATWIRVRYQKHDEKPNWRLLHLRLKPDEYEYYLDLRKVFKYSVSCLVALAVERYLDEILKKLYDSADNYRYQNYMFTRAIIDGVVCWILSWGIPRNIIIGHY